MAQINKPTDYFNTILRNGTGASVTPITGVGFQPDFIWQKRRNSASSHHLTDSVRGATKLLYSELTTAEQTNANFVQSIDSDGFTMGSADWGTSDTVVAWNWLGGGTASSNTDGTITSQVSANTTSGFSIATYTGNKTSGATIGHGLGAVPSMVIVKNRTAGTDGWLVYHKDVGNTKFLYLNDTSAALTSSQAWNNTTPSSLVVTLGNSDLCNGSGENLVAYCFAEKKGFSKFGSYTGNGNADGTFVYTGFRPAFVIFKKSSSANDWIMKDSVREPNNQMAYRLKPNSSNAEDSLSGGQMDFLSNGFKFRVNDDVSNASGGTYIYMAFAESPLVGTNNIPAVAR